MVSPIWYMVDSILVGAYLMLLATIIHRQSLPPRQSLLREIKLMPLTVVVVVVVVITKDNGVITLAWWRCDRVIEKLVL